MKRFLMFWVIVSGMVASATGQNNNLVDLMRQNMSRMHAVELTGDPDYDFSKMMTMHHQGGMSMTNAILGSNADSKIKDLAAEIHEDQENDMAELNKFTSGQSGSEPDSEFLSDMKAHMQQAHVEMSRMNRLTGDMGKDFLILMTLHHDHGIKLTDIVLKHGKSSELKAMAKQMREKHQKQKSQLDELK